MIVPREVFEVAVAALSVIALAVAMPFYAPILANRWLDPFPMARGKALDELAANLGFTRRRYWWFFKESDRSLRDRMAAMFSFRQRPR